MVDVPSSQQGIPGWLTRQSDTSNYSILEFMTERMLARISTATLVKVEKVTNSGEVKEVGQVDVTPLVNLTDGFGNTSKHGKLHSLAYFRIQGGGKAIIMDPKVGDIGVAVFADRDISGVKKNKKQSPPSSYRRFDMADGLFFPCFLGGTPTCYIRFTDDNKMIARTSDAEWVVADTHVQMKKHGDPDLHITVDIANSKLIAGKDFEIAPDPYPGD